MSDVTTYLRGELDKAQRRLRVTLIAGGVIALIMVGYFTWLRSEVADILEPANLADFIANETRRNLPEAREVVRGSLTQAAPEVVRFVLHQVVEGVLPNITTAVKEHLADMSQQLARTGGEGVIAAFSATLRGYKAELGKKKATSGATAERLVAYVEGHLPQQLDIASQEHLRTKLDASAQALKQMDAELRAMATRTAKTREDELGKRLVTTWWTFLDRNRPHLPGADLWNMGPDRPSK